MKNISRKPNHPYDKYSYVFNIDEIIPEIDKQPVKRRIPIQKKLSEFRKIVLDVFVLLILCIVFPLAVYETLNTRVSVIDIKLPEYMTDMGYDNTLYLERIGKSIQAIISESSTEKPLATILPTSDEINIELPDTGLSLEAFRAVIRRIVKIIRPDYFSSLVGELVCESEPCIRENTYLRVHQLGRFGSSMDTIPIGHMKDDEYFRVSALKFLEIVEPYVVSRYYYLSDEKDKSSEIAWKMISAGSDDSKWAYNIIGTLELEKGDHKSAQIMYQNAIDLDPGFVAPVVNMGISFKRQGDRKKAKQYFKKAVEIENEHTLANYNLGNVFFEELNCEGAIKHYNRVLSADPDYENARVNLGITFLKQGAVGLAVEQARYLTEYAPDNPRGFRLLGMGLVAERKYRGAMEAFEQSLEIDGSHLQTRIGLALIAIQQSDSEKYISELEAIRVISPNNDLADELNDMISKHKGDHEKLRQEVEDTIEKALRYPGGLCVDK